VKFKPHSGDPTNSVDRTPVLGFLRNRIGLWLLSGGRERAQPWKSPSYFSAWLAIPVILAYSSFEDTPIVRAIVAVSLTDGHVLRVECFDLAGSSLDGHQATPACRSGLPEQQSAQVLPPYSCRGCLLE